MNYYERESTAKNLRTLRQLESVRAELGHGGLFSPAGLEAVASPSWLDTARAYHAVLTERSDADRAEHPSSPDLAGYSVPQPVRVDGEPSPWDQGARGEFGLFLVHVTCTGNTVVAAGVDGVYIWARRRESIAGIRSLGWEAPAELVGEPTREQLVKRISSLEITLSATLDRLAKVEQLEAMILGLGEALGLGAGQVWRPEETPFEERRRAVAVSLLDEIIGRVRFGDARPGSSLAGLLPQLEDLLAAIGGAQPVR